MKTIKDYNEHYYPSDFGSVYRKKQNAKIVIGSLADDYVICARKDKFDFCQYRSLPHITPVYLSNHQELLKDFERVDDDKLPFNILQAANEFRGYK